MKKYLLLFTLVIGALLFGQEVKIEHPEQSVVDQQAEYVGGTRAFQTKAGSFLKVKLPAGSYSTSVKFVVDEGGNVVNVTATGPNEKFNEAAIKAVKKVKEKWTPAMFKGKPAKSYFTFPFRMNAE